MSFFNNSNDKLLYKKDEAERPFWISFSDLMSALMVLFLVAMSVAMISITEQITETEEVKNERQDEINELLETLAIETQSFDGITLRGQVIDFGERARFDTNSHKLSEEQGELLRQFIPKVLKLARNPKGEKWLKRIVVEGFADSRGNYLYNLNLSLQRSQRVMCMLLKKEVPAELNILDKQLVKDIFRVSGASFNALKYSEEESRRIELRLEFRNIDEIIYDRSASGEDDGKCPLDN